VILSTNPDHPKHWINTRLIKGGQAAVYRSGAHDNPHNPLDYLATLDLLTGVRRLRLRDGKWVQAEGAVYADFDYDVHLVDAFPVPAGWRRIRSIDFGYTNPFTCQWWAINPDGRMYLYREIYKTQVLVEDHADEIKRLGAGCSRAEWDELSARKKKELLAAGERFEATVADHDAEDRATLARYGVPTLPAKKDVSPGIQAVQARLRVAGDGKPRLMLMRGALVAEDRRLREAKKPLCLEDEMPGYEWEPAREGAVAKEAPVKLDDHGVDAMRYAVMHLDSAPKRPSWGVHRV
jgi:phage terminase large subunit